MAQMSLYVEDALVEKLSAAARARNCSISKYVKSIINERLFEEESDEMRKKQILRELRGALDDATFNEPPEIPSEAEIPRRFDLI
ncbi:MAG: hypothetical protein FWF87_04620 [Synergistaceae bacterium]|nr:hypothetical protein [Synergistaceae bacterium]